MKRNTKFILLILIILIIASLVLLMVRNKNNQGNVLTTEQALQMAKEKYNLLLDYAQGNNMELSGNSDNSEGYSFDEKYYLKIDNYNDTIKENILDENIDNFCNIAKIIENNKNYYINIDSIDRKKDATYESTGIVLKSVTKDEIVCDAESFYITYDDKGNKNSSKVTQEFRLKKVKDTWKVSRFELPY